MTFFRTNGIRFFAAAGAIAAIAGAAGAQQAGEPNSAQSLRLPANPNVFGGSLPSVVKATAIVNGAVITQTDIGQRLAYLAVANGGEIPSDQIDTLRDQILRNLIDETLQIQAARANEITIKSSDIDKAVERVAQNVQQTPKQLAEYLAANGSSIETMRRQIEGELAWQGLQRRKIESSINVGDDEVNAVIARLEAAKGKDEYRVGEIFLSATPATQQEAIANAYQILEQLKRGASFAGYARQYSEASTAAVGGDLGWVRPEQLPPELATALSQMTTGSVSNPLPVPGGVSIIAVQDSRKVLTADPRDAVLALKQISVTFPPGTSKAAAEPVVARFAEAVQNIGGCGGAERVAGQFNAEIVTSDGIKLRDLPPALQQMMLPMQVGQATRPFGQLDEGVRSLVICGRDEAAETAKPSFDQIYNQLADERINSRSRRYLRDLRRDAVIEFR